VLVLFVALMTMVFIGCRSKPYDVQMNDAVARRHKQFHCIL